MTKGGGGLGFSSCPVFKQPPLSSTSARGIFCGFVSYIRVVGIAPHKACYSRSSEVTSSFTLQAYFQFFTTLQNWFAFPCCHHPAYFAVCLSLLEQPLLSELLWSGTPITKISHASLQQSLSLRQGKFLRRSDQMDVKNILVTGLRVFLLHTGS